MRNGDQVAIKPTMHDPSLVWAVMLMNVYSHYNVHPSEYMVLGCWIRWVPNLKHPWCVLRWPISKSARFYPNAWSSICCVLSFDVRPYDSPYSAHGIPWSQSITAGHERRLPSCWALAAVLRSPLAAWRWKTCFIPEWIVSRKGQCRFTISHYIPFVFLEQWNGVYN